VIFGENLNKKNLDSAELAIRAALLGALFIVALCPASFGQSRTRASGRRKITPEASLLE